MNCILSDERQKECSQENSPHSKSPQMFFCVKREKNNMKAKIDWIGVNIPCWEMGYLWFLPHNFFNLLCEQKLVFDGFSNFPLEKPSLFYLHQSVFVRYNLSLQPLWMLKNKTLISNSVNRKTNCINQKSWEIAFPFENLPKPDVIKVRKV